MELGFASVYTSKSYFYSFVWGGVRKSFFYFFLSGIDYECFNMYCKPSEETKKNFSLPPGLPLGCFQGCHGPKNGLKWPKSTISAQVLNQGGHMGYQILRLDETHQGRPNLNSYDHYFSSYGLRQIFKIQNIR